MAYRNNNPFQVSRQDTGWGLIFRLNLLLGKVEKDVEDGNLDKWNLHLDRIYVNILYKNPTEIIKDEYGNPTEINFSEEDTKVFQRFATEIRNIKNALLNVEDDENRNKNIHQLKEKLYNVIFKKDVWIRKRMFELKLYLREAESDPRKAIYGG